VEKLKQDGGVGYTTEPAKAFTCDGNPNGENVYNNVYRITSKVLDLTTITSFTFVHGGQSTTMTKEEFIGMGGQVTSEDIGADGMGWLAYTISTDGDKPVGTYVWCGEEGYVSRIEFAETVHPIDPKYLGGVVLPVVEIANFQQLTEEESAKLSECIGYPCIIKTHYFSFLLNYAEEDGVKIFTNFEGIDYIFSDGHWFLKQ
jgi:L-ascorbate metabolism protein UlaG (beta-lactamase superfamily)